MLLKVDFQLQVPPLMYNINEHKISDVCAIRLSRSSMTKIIFELHFRKSNQNLCNFTQITIKVIKIELHALFKGSTFKNVFTNLNPVLKLKNEMRQLV